MVLESMWADAPDNVESSKKTKHKKTTTPKTRKDIPKEKPTVKTENGGGKKKKLEQEPPKNRLIFSVKDVPVKNQKSAPTIQKTNDKKLELLKKKIEEQKKILHENQHKKEQKELLEEFLNGDSKFDWGDEDEENEIIEKLNNSLKV